jgi:hypothetical protein
MLTPQGPLFKSVSPFNTERSNLAEIKPVGKGSWGKIRKAACGVLLPLRAVRCPHRLSEAQGELLRRHQYESDILI